MRFTTVILFASAVSSALAAPIATPIDELWRRASSSVTTNVSVAQAKQYTHVVVGCGLSGLAVAVRLSENPKNTVLCLEAGGDSRTDSRVVSLYQYGQAFGTELDWAWQTTSQEAGGKTHTIRGGKTLGGSTAINNGVFTMGSSAEYDNIGTLGNEGWSWNSLQPYLQKFQSYTPPSDVQMQNGAEADYDIHGYGGPINVSFTPGFYTGPQQPAFVEAVKEALNVSQIADLTSGDSPAVAYTQNTVLPQGNAIRVSSATGYLTPVQNSRSNLVVLINYRGIKMNWSGSGSSHTAKSVVAQSSKSGPQYTFAASKKVIVSAGAIRTPLFLEASGVGDSSVLSSIKVNQVINLPGVGRNLQEQTMNSIGLPGPTDFGGNGPSSVIAYPSISQLMSNASAVGTWVNQNVATWAQNAVDAGAAVSQSGLLKMYQSLANLIFQQNAPVVEMFGDSGFPADGFGIDHWQLLPFSRGYVHSTDATGWSHPNLNPRYFSCPLDMQITVAGLRGSRKTLQTDAITSALDGQTESVPGFDASSGGIPDTTDGGSYANWQSWVLKGYASVHHPLGTAAMLPQADGGVVDSNFQVYNTTNVYVVDASVLPHQLSAHLSASLYTFAEKAASIIGSS